MCEKETPNSVVEYQIQLQLYAQAAAARLRLAHPSLAVAAAASGNPAAVAAAAAYNFATINGYPHPAFSDNSISPYHGLPHFGRYDGRFRFINEEPKPQHSYIGLIAMAILSTPEQRMILSDIYKYILDNYPYFHHRGHGWRNSIRHNLSLNPCFIKSTRSANGKGHYWTIHPANLDDFKKGDFRRRKAQRKAAKHDGYAIREDDSSSSTSPTPTDTPTETSIGLTGSPSPPTSPNPSPPSTSISTSSPSSLSSSISLSTSSSTPSPIITTVTPNSNTITLQNLTNNKNLISATIRPQISYSYHQQFQHQLHQHHLQLQLQHHHHQQQQQQQQQLQQINNQISCSPINLQLTQSTRSTSSPVESTPSPSPTIDTSTSPTSTTTKSSTRNKKSSKLPISVNQQKVNHDDDNQLFINHHNQQNCSTTVTLTGNDYPNKKIKKENPENLIIERGINESIELEDKLLQLNHDSIKTTTINNNKRTFDVESLLAPDASKS
ncbi:forkhead box protein A2-like [Panonychus citri]|uniref:forkhead box protein A2-like n=1 Tax=Panonychus citri TaxID=50023 RepID=UPI0023072BC9|nr:forkhead box protein A2-like [Panonychus citri]